MRAKLKEISSNDTGDWDPRGSADQSNAIHWFTLRIGPAGEKTADDFQVALATHRAVDQRVDKHRPFKGLILDPFVKAKVEPLIRSWVDQIQGDSWEAIVQQLRQVMIWEYE